MRFWSGLRGFVASRLPALPVALQMPDIAVAIGDQNIFDDRCSSATDAVDYDLRVFSLPERSERILRFVDEPTVDDIKSPRQMAVCELAFAAHIEYQRCGT